MAFLLLIGLFQLPEKSHASEDPLNVYAKAAILVDAKTGKILYGKNIDTPLGIASMTKMMTEYLLLEAIHKGKVTWDQKYSVDDYVYKISQDKSLSNVPLRRDGQYTIRQLYQAVAIYSADAANIAIAETLAGSETNFIQMMNDKAKELGLTDYKFVNSTGLNNSDLKGMYPKVGGPNDENQMSARSVAKLAYSLLKDYPEILQTASIPKLNFQSDPNKTVTMENWNWMLPSLIFGKAGVDGLKTGTTNYAGYCFTGTAQRNGMRVITVVMNATDASGQGGYKARFTETSKLMDYGFSNFSEKQLYPANYTVKNPSSLSVVKGKDKQVNIQTNAPLTVDVKNGEENLYKPVFHLDQSKLNKSGELTAPVKKGEVVGSLVANYTGSQDYGYLYGANSAKADVVTSKSVDKANWFVLSMRGVGGFFSSVFHGIAKTVKGWF
jgi:D-alanyl-D-alanine carboxypeptidase (penicillin-binding protein 5/6)